MVLPLIAISPVGDKTPLSESSSNILIDSGTTSSLAVSKLFPVMLMDGVTMDNGLVSLSAVALTTVSPLLSLKSMPVMFTLSGPSSDIAGTLNIGVPSPVLVMEVPSLPARVTGLVMFTSATSV